MNLQQIQFETYKAFKEKQTFDLKPITVIVGKNSSGKSALVRLPLLISQSLKTNSDEPLKIEFDNIEFGGAFTDLIYNKFSHGNLAMSLTFEPNISISFEIQNISETPLQIISKYHLTTDALDIDMEIVFDRENVNRREDRFYIVNGEKLRVDFRGVFPAFIVKNDGTFLFNEELSLLWETLDVYANKIEYIGPLRETAHRTYSYSGSVPKRLGYKGELAPQILGMSTFLDEDLLSNVGKWFKEHMGYEISVSKELRSFEVVLKSPNDPSVQINIVDVGLGISQVLPLIVRCFQPDLENTVTIIEQPELHLHPAAHGDIAELFAMTSRNQNCTFLIETHSENIILRIRRLVTEKAIRPENVIIYWIDDDGTDGSHLEAITIDEMGNLSNWPKGVFSEAYEEVLAIHAAQKTHRNDT